MSALTTAQVAAAAGCSVSYVQILRRLGVIVPASAEPRRRIYGGHGIDYRFDETAVEICRASKAAARARQRDGGQTPQAERSPARRHCSRRHLPFSRNCVHHDLPNACEICEARYAAASVAGIAGSGTGTAADLAGVSSGRAYRHGGAA